MPNPELSVVIAVFNRGESVSRLLAQLAQQSLARNRYEVVLVDDGSSPPVHAALDASSFPFALTVLTQDNSGPAVARHAGIVRAVGSLVLCLDDDMRVGPEFLAAHVNAHARAVAPHVVLGRLRAPERHPLRLFERFQLAQIERLAHRASVDPTALRGGHLYGGNVSFPRALYLDVGGFDPALRLSEDAELGMRFEQAGAHFSIVDAAAAEHASDHASLSRWMARSEAYGEADSRIAAKHAGFVGASPWRFLYAVNIISRPLLSLAVLSPTLGRWLARAVLFIAQLLSAIGLERVAMSATTLAYGLLYFAGVRRAAGSLANASGDLRLYLQHESSHNLGRMGRMAKCFADIRADQQALHAGDARYRASTTRGSLLGDFIQRIGFQLMVAYRIMRLYRALHLGLLARIQSRLIRHLYGADIHWDADLAPGVVIVHGVGLVISHAARVGSGCILFQHVTLGESIHPVSRRVGAPTLEAGVHVAPGAVLLGPIVVGAGSKVAANTVVTESVPPHSIVSTVPATVRVREVTVEAARDDALIARPDEQVGLGDRAP